MNDTATPTSQAKPKHEMGLLGMFGVLVGGGCLLISALGVVNTAFDLDLALRVSGSRMDLPDNWEVVWGLVAVGVLLIGLSYFGSFVTGKFKDAKGKPLVRVGILAGAFGLLFLVGRGLQVMALVSTYGSMLAYYATDGDLEDVKAELEKEPSPEDLDAAVGRAAQYDNVEALKLLLAAGANLNDETGDPEYRSCILGNGDLSLDFVKVALDAGTTAQTCPKPEEVVYRVVSSSDDAPAAAKIPLLVAAGFPVDTHPDYTEETPLAAAQKENKSATVAALQAAGAQ